MLFALKISMALIINALKTTSNLKSNSPAISFQNETWTYAQLASWSDQFAAHLVNDIGVKPNDIVAVHTKRSLELIGSLIALLKIGATYLPLDADYPKLRLEYMLHQSRSQFLITTSKMLSLNTTTDGLQKIDLDLFKVDLKNTNAFEHNQGEHNAYLLYTSGTTGNPKGILMGTASLAHMLEWQNAQTALKSNSITLQFSPIGFDVHFQEIFSTLICGGHLILISEEDKINSNRLIEVIKKHHVNRLYLPFVALNSFCETAVRTNNIPMSLREVTTAGEQLKISPNIRKFFKSLPDISFYNHYGPTETHGIASLQLSCKSADDIDAWPSLPTIGHPVGDCKFLILNDKMEPVKTGDVVKYMRAEHVWQKAICSMNKLLRIDLFNIATMAVFIKRET